MYFNKDSYSLYYEKHGDSKKQILILPGWGDTRKTFDFMVHYLKTKYTVYIIDYPGFGKSLFPEHDLNIYDYANMIRDFMKHEEIESPIIIAHSFGGRIATLLSGYYKEKIEKLILIDSAGIKPKRTPYKIARTYVYKFLKKLKVFVPKRKRNFYLKRLLNIFGSSDYKALNQSMYQTFKNIVNVDLKYYLKSIDVKTLIIWGRNDKDTKIRDAHIMNKYIKNSKLYIFDDASHFSYLNYPTSTNQIINEFIEDSNT